MSYRDVMGFVNVLYGIRIPRRNGVPLGGTEFPTCMPSTTRCPPTSGPGLPTPPRPQQLREILGAHAPRQGERAPADVRLQRKQRPPVVHPLFLTHPITGRKVLYCNPATMRINELSERESDEMLEYLFDFQLEQRFRYTHTWNENDLLVWDHLGTIHRAIADYGPDEIRLMRRCQVMATKVFDPDFLRPVRALAEVA